MIDHAPDTWHDEPAKLAPWVTKEDADRKALRSFWRGVLIGGLMIGAILVWWLA